nr:nucleotide-binding alpha-beta plait domain-containing protein [Tanacetum cinerariifolium]
MGKFNSKEDDVNRISNSIYVTNFPKTCSAKDLFNACKQYGHVVDVFIPTKRSKEGKTFGFVRFINIFNVDRLRDLLYNNVRSAPIKDDRIRRDVNKPQANGGSSVSGKTFATAVKNNFNHINVEKDDSPMIVLDDEHVTDRDLLKSLLGRVKVFSSLTNLKVALNNKRFVDIKVKYMEELWVLMEFNSVKSKDLFCDNVGVRSWFAELVPAGIDFNPEGRILWVEVEGVPFKFWSQSTFYKIAAKWGELLEMDDPDENCYHSRRLCVYTKVHSNVFENFKLTFQGKVFWIRAKEVLGWVPELLEDMDEEELSENESLIGTNKSLEDDKEADNGDMEAVPDTVFEDSTGQKKNGSEDPFGIYSILTKNTMCKNDNGDAGTLSHPLGFTPNDDVDLGNEVNEDNCDVDEGNKRGTEVKDTVRTKDDQEDSISVSRFKLSKAPRTGGGILCVWDSCSFRKSNHTILNYFVLIRAVWLKSGIDTLIVAVYPPHDLRDKHMVWEYLVTVIKQWKGNVMLMGDFNEVRYKSDRFGLTFNVQGAVEFNYFINDADLEETNYDYGPFPFWSFQHWFELDGFNKFVIDSWNVVPGDVSNGMLNLVYKLKSVKVRIREWIKDYRSKCNGAMDRYKEELRVLDEAVDKGQGSDSIANKRVEIINNIFRLEHLHFMDMAQKVKPRDVKREFFSHFRDRLAKSSDQRILINMEFLNSISSEQQADLQRLVSREELKTAVWDCGTDKSSGPDGFTFGFYRQFWSTIENDVFDVVNHFFSCSDIPKGCNSSFIALISKVPAANLVKDFRPISLIGSVYKIIAKILSNRLVGVLGDIVNEVQSAFIADRHILDGPFILNEVIQ